MKNITVLIASLFFSTLFYKQGIGLNLSLFSLLTVIILRLNNKNAFAKRSVILYSVLYLTTSITVFFYSSQLTIIANCVVFFTLIGSISEHKTSIYVNWLNGVYTSIAGFFHRNFDYNEAEETPKLKQDIDLLHWVKIIGIPLTIIIIFIALYKNGNPVFNDFISKIDFSYINLQWILLTVLGYYLFNNIANPVLVDPATSIDLKVENTLLKNDSFSEEELKKENQLGTILMVLLNLLIVFYLVTDVTYILELNNLSAAELSNQVHNGVGALIASIVIAIVVILYFFRGNLNFYRHNKNLKILTYCWIALNIFLVFAIAVKNYQYINSFGLTYKRIGVNIYLILTSIGLITAFLKIVKLKNIIYLIRVNFKTAFAILILCSLINWDNGITNYNLNHAKVLDMDYLINLSNNNTLQLKKYNDKYELSNTNRNKIANKYFEYEQQLKQENWQEMSYGSFKIETTNPSN